MGSNPRRTEIKNELINACGGVFASKSKLRKLLNIGTQGLDEFLSGMEYWERSGRQYYLLSDVAGRIYHAMEYSVLPYTSYCTSLRKPDLRGMKRDQIALEIKRNGADIIGNEFDGFFATAPQISKALSINQGGFKLHFGDLEYLQLGNKKFYYLKDIAARIREHRKISI